MFRKRLKSGSDRTEVANTKASTPVRATTSAVLEVTSSTKKRAASTISSNVASETIKKQVSVNLLSLIPISTVVS